MDRLEAMALLVAVTDSGSFSGAAKALGMPLATLSRKVSDLEAHLKTRLLQRSTRRLTVTEAGRTYLDACRSILDQVGEAERAASGEYTAPKGGLVITAPISLGRLHVLPVVSAFLEAYPDIHIRLLLSDRNVHLLDDHIDAAIRVGDLPDSSLMARRLGTIRRVVCASPGYLAQRGTPQSPEDLSGHSCIVFSSLGSAPVWTFLASGRDLNVRVQPRLEVNTAEAAIDAARSGLGVTRLLCYQIDQARRQGDLTEILSPFEPKPYPVNLIHAGQRLLPLKLRAFLDFAAPRLSASLASGL